MIFQMTDLSAEAQRIHSIFESSAYALAIIFILLAVIMNYFKLSFFDFAPSASETVSRAFIAFILMFFYPDIANAVATISDSFAEKIGSLNQIDHVLARMGEKLESFSWNWTSVKDSLILGFSFITFFLLYISVYIANAGTLFVWIILYVLSPLLIIFYIFPETSSATKALFRSLIEVSLWKTMWAILAALLWSSALGAMNANSEIHFLTVVSYNLILGFSVILTPVIVHMLVGAGLSGIAASAVTNLTRGLDPVNFAKNGVSKAATATTEKIYTGKNLKPSNRTQRK